MKKALFTLILGASNDFMQTSLAKTEKIKVHIVSHSHMDAGWQKTYDEYYDQYVKRILTSVTQKLIKDRKFTFTIGDLAFFRRFYESQPRSI